jgi:hypothetical protein
VKRSPRHRRRKRTPRQRYADCMARKQNGVVRIVLEAEGLWLAEMLYRAGEYCHPDQDDPAVLERATRALISFLIEAAKDGALTRLNFPETDLA